MRLLKPLVVTAAAVLLQSACNPDLLAPSEFRSQADGLFDAPDTIGAAPDVTATEDFDTLTQTTPDITQNATNDAALGTGDTSADCGACDDGNACTIGDYCEGGVCLAGVATSCDDGNPCTTDACGPATGCTHVANEEPCSDGNACTSLDACKEMGCVGGATIDCNDQQSCTADSCLQASGCQHVPANDGANCSEAQYGLCEQGACKAQACPPGYDPVDIEAGGAATKACAALGPVWGNAPDKPVGVYSVLEPVAGAGKVVLDSQTKLMWQQTSAASPLAWEAAKKHCDGLAYAGLDDWRLPSLHELMSLQDYLGPQNYPIIDGSAFPGTSKAWYWTATAQVKSAARFVVGFESYNFTTNFVLAVGGTAEHEVRCVRANGAVEMPGPRYVVSSSGEAVTDTWTKLVWQRKVAAGKKSWDGAMSYCSQGLTLAGKTGWRLPRVRELVGITDSKASFPSIAQDAFPGTPATNFWSATHPDIYNSLFVEFGYGGGGVMGIGGSAKYEVRCVRDGG